MLQQLLLQGAAGLNEGAAVDGLVGHVVALVAWMSMLEPTSDLFRRPQHPQLLGHDAGQCAVLRQLAPLRTTSSLPCRLFGLICAIRTTIAIALDLSTDSRWRPLEPGSN